MDFEPMRIICHQWASPCGKYREIERYTEEEYKFLNAVPDLDFCPFCGGKASYTENSYRFVPRWGVQCLKCGIKYQENHKTRKGAADAWNRRR